MRRYLSILLALVLFLIGSAIAEPDYPSSSDAIFDSLSLERLDMTGYSVLIPMTWGMAYVDGSNGDTHYFYSNGHSDYFKGSMAFATILKSQEKLLKKGTDTAYQEALEGMNVDTDYSEILQCCGMPALLWSGGMTIQGEYAETVGFVLLLPDKRINIFYRNHPADPENDLSLMRVIGQSVIPDGYTPDPAEESHDDGSDEDDAGEAEEERAATDKPVPVTGSFDLSEMTYDELVALKDQINLAIWNSAEWQEVTVPQGTWVVGEDIPAGTWTVKCGPNFYWCTIRWGDKLMPNGELVDYVGTYSYGNMVFNPSSEYYDEGDGITEYTFTVTDGQYVIVDLDGGPAIFMPYAGKPSLGFK